MNQWTLIPINGIEYVRVMACELETGDVNVDHLKLTDIDLGEYNFRVKLTWSNGYVQYLRYNTTVLIDAKTVV